MTTNNFLRLFTVFFLSSVPPIASAASLGPFNIIEAAPLDETWLNAGFLSYHFQKDRNLDDNNPGLGAEYRYSTVNSITAGRFHNSDRQMSSYAAWVWQPLELGSVRFGALMGGIDGYPKANNGGWIPLVLPVASFEYHKVGFNLTLIPTYKDMLHGSLSLQLKLKVF